MSLPATDKLLLNSEPESAGIARQFVRQYVENHVPHANADHLDACVLVTSELVTNSIRYGTEPGDLVRLVLGADGTRTRIEVHDPVRRRPCRRPESARRARGRGLLVLDALCPDRWGVSDRPMGKAVWAEVVAT
ncbi:ATP-binding protein [Streptomyces sp. NRRL F-2799]|uniref:ATP-binding protein n=1 Tax=Streptomyces sp. NRRL F-2799 TaxID=1463844 RepID=UPI0004CA3DB4|nr:ATP-binding protein [Streptomyces sp. NRRL F-2799]